jgi:hypothetical protein
MIGKNPFCLEEAWKKGRKEFKMHLIRSRFTGILQRLPRMLETEIEINFRD